MAAANTDKFTHVGVPGTATTMAAPGHTIGGTVINVSSTANWPTDTGVIFATDTFTVVSGKAVRDANSYREWEGVVTSGTQISNIVPRLGADDINYPAGSTTRVYIPVASSRENRLVDGILTGHNQDGTHKAFTETNIIPTASIQDNAVTTAKVVDSAITTAKLATGAVTADKLSGSKLIGVGPSFMLNGPTTTATTFKIQAGTTVGSGIWTVTLPTAFSTGVLTVMLSNGDIGANAGLIGLVDTTLSSFRTNCTIGGTYRINYIAIGW